MNIPSNVSILVGLGYSICGGAPVIDANNDEIAKSISIIFLFNIIAAVSLPMQHVLHIL